MGSRPTRRGRDPQHDSLFFLFGFFFITKTETEKSSQRPFLSDVGSRPPRVGGRDPNQRSFFSPLKQEPKQKQKILHKNGKRNLFFCRSGVVTPSGRGSRPQRPTISLAKADRRILHRHDSIRKDCDEMKKKNKRTIIKATPDNVRNHYVILGNNQQLGRHQPRMEFHSKVVTELLYRVLSVSSFPL